MHVFIQFTIRAGRRRARMALLVTRSTTHIPANVPITTTAPSAKVGRVVVSLNKNKLNHGQTMQRCCRGTQCNDASVMTVICIVQRDHPLQWVQGTQTT